MIAVVRRLRAAHPGADEYAGTVLVDQTDIQRRVGDGLRGGDQRELADAVEHAQTRRREMRGRVEVDRRADMRARDECRIARRKGVGRRIETANR